MEIFDVARVLGSLFGVGDGRVVLRAAADFIGERRSRVPDQGGTRKIVAPGNTVDHLLTHHRNFHAAMHARLGLVGAGRSAQTQTKLIEVQALLSRKAPVFKESWAAFQPVFKEGWTAFQQLAFKAGRLFSSWPFGHFANKMTSPMPQSVGPKFARNALISLD